MNSQFPNMRMRRLRETSMLRDLVRETRLHPHDFIYPLFVHHQKDFKKEISTMPGQFQLGIDELLRSLDIWLKDGLRSIILFGIPSQKDNTASGAYDEHGVVQQAIRAIRARKLPLLVMADVCLCEYTSHGHCGIVHGQKIDNDKTLPLLARSALSYAEAGVDVVAPSDMMDGRVLEIRHALDSNGFAELPILSYAAKYSSAFYGPFREAAESAPAFGDRRSHQMDAANVLEAERECALDIAEGADMLMVKPAGAYLDVIYRIKQKFGLPLAAYAVSGEYSMIEAAATQGLLDKERVVYESLLAIKRAGADRILSYHTPYVLQKMNRREFVDFY